MLKVKMPHSFIHATNINWVQFSLAPVAGDVAVNKTEEVGRW